MVKIDERTKLFLSAIFITSLIFALIYILSSFKVQIFHGDKFQAANLLGTLVQGLTAIVAIVFTLILFVSQFTLGKYVTRTIDYVLLNWLNFLTLVFGIATILLNVITLWNLSMEHWRLYVDLSVILFILFMILMFLFFLSIPSFLKPKRILDSIQREILRKEPKDREFISRKIELLFSVVRKLRDNGESSDALYGINLLGDTIRSINLGEEEFLFLQSAISKLEDIGIESIEKQPSLTMNTVGELRKILNFVERKGFFLEINIGNQVVSSSLSICENSIDTRHAKSLIQMTYSLVLNFYELCASKDGSIITFGPEALNRLLHYSEVSNLPSYYLLSFEPQWVISRLFKKGRTEEAFILFEILVNRYPRHSQTLIFCIDILFESVRENEDFAKKVVEKIINNFESVKVEIKTKKGKTGRTISVRNSDVRIETGDEDKDVALWIKNSLER